VWFGGKRRVADEVWRGLGDVDNYVEPFAGSLAVLLDRPHSNGDGRRRTETVNDADAFLANFWRALRSAPDEVAYHCDQPVNETDLFARHLWLVNTGRDRLANLEADPDWYDAKVAGWWVWGVNSWIGSGWCSGTGPWRAGNAGRGVNRKLPHLGDAGRGVNRAARSDIAAYLRALADRLRGVRVCCGDWSRVVTRGALSYGATVGVFLDPPYLGEVRTSDLYSVDDHTIAHSVRHWCLVNGDDPRYRIVLAGYGPEHDHLMPPTWRRHYWTASASYSTTASAVRGDGNHANRGQEVLWFSPHCLTPDTQLDMFEGLAL
jgi:DNA adenine methylase